jgi:hypothetical protein
MGEEIRNARKRMCMSAKPITLVTDTEGADLTAAIEVRTLELDGMRTSKCSFLAPVLGSSIRGRMKADLDCWVRYDDMTLLRIF